MLKLCVPEITLKEVPRSMRSLAIFSASSGIRQNLQTYAAAVGRISDPAANSGIDEIVEMKRAEQGLKVNAAVIEASDKMTGLLIDMIV